MAHYIIELVIWSLVAYFIGCLIGWLLRGMFGSTAVPVAAESAPAPAPMAEPSPEPAREAAPVVEAEPQPQPVASPRMERPKGIAAPRGGKSDDLQEISGIGPKNEKILHTLGFFHFDQIAQWGEGEIAWVDDHLKFNGRITREKWVEQATLLAAGDRQEFNRLFGTGGKNR